MLALGSVTSGIPLDWAAAENRPGVKLLKDFSDDTVKHIGEKVREVKRERDVVVASIHWGPNWGYEIPRDQIAFAHRLIDDADIDAIHGHSSHHVKGIEVYKGKVIFHSLCNFGMDTGIHRSNPGRWDATFRPERDPEYPTYPFSPDARKTIMVKCLMSDKRIKRVSFLPFMINKLGQPEPLSRKDKRSDEVYEYVVWCCQDQKLDANFVREGDEIVVCT